ncbi:MAG: PQQ-dependent sugar dehydrogenase, partial [Caulobacteraceae bacterium]
MKKLLSLGLLLFASTASAQQAPKYGVTSPPPNPPQYGVKPAPFAATPYVFDTAEQHGIKVTVLAKGFKRPFGMAFLPDGDLLISERGADLRIVHKPTSASPVLDPNPVPGMPKTGRSGLHDIA